MRMWLVDPKCMCTKHLLGEHLEMHMFVGAIAKGKSIDGYVKNGLVQPELLEERHDDLVAEMERRGMDHKSPLEQPDVEPCGHVDSDASLAELRKRCSACRAMSPKNTIEIEVTLV